MVGEEGGVRKRHKSGVACVGAPEDLRALGPATISTVDCSDEPALATDRILGYNGGARIHATSSGGIFFRLSQLECNPHCSGYICLP